MILLRLTTENEKKKKNRSAVLFDLFVYETLMLL